MIQVIVLILFVLSGCVEEENLPDLGTKFASPMGTESFTLTVDGTESSYFVVLNADVERNYNRGSLVVMNQEGGLVAGPVPVNRLGRSLRLAQGVSGEVRMIVTYQYADDSQPNAVELYEITGGTSVSIERKKVFFSGLEECIPLNSALADGYQYFAVSCENGDLFVGDFGTSDLTNAQIKRVRSFGFTRRAMHIDATEQLLYLFPTDLGRQNYQDNVLEDRYSYDDELNQSEVRNEIPDIYEATRRARRARFSRYKYQFVLFDLAAEFGRDLDETGMPAFRELEQEDDPTPEYELRWLYFTLDTLDGTPEEPDPQEAIYSRVYRTNIWSARPHPIENSTFFISHRGLTTGANNLVRVRLQGDPRPNCTAYPTTCVPPTGEVFRFDRVYGFNGEKDELSLIGDFNIRVIQGQEIAIINNFRDLQAFRRSANQRSSISVKNLGDPYSLREVFAPGGDRTYHDVATIVSGSQIKALTCSFYHDTVVPFDIIPSESITVGTPIESL